MKFQALIDGVPVKKHFVAKEMAAIWRQFNKYAKSKGFGTEEWTPTALGGMVWVHSDGRKMSIKKCE